MTSLCNTVVNDVCHSSLKWYSLYVCASLCQKRVCNVQHSVLSSWLTQDLLHNMYILRLHYHVMWFLVARGKQLHVLYFPLML
uniref:Uncharacterized protein n=1 Tax=Rhipicephalus zambeziensis TaxID=60191 RepID=A0A224YCL7_9ACAR